MPRCFRLPVPAPVTPSPEAFMLVPLSSLPPLAPDEAARQRALYQWAFDEAQAVVQPSLLERDLLGVWN
jgi:hypothetical protein